MSGAAVGSDRVTVNAGAGADIVDASGLSATSALLTVDGVDGVTSAAAAGADWVPTHAHTVDGNTVLDLGERQVTLPRADITDLVPDAPSS